MGKKRLQELTTIADENPPIHKFCGQPMVYGLVEGSSSSVIDSETGIGLDWICPDCPVYPTRFV
jgi:hypothetical protein